MWTKTFTTFNELEEFILPLLAENKWIFDMKKLSDSDEYIVNWREHKTYTALDEKEYLDEIWITEKENMMLVQEMSEAHVRNTLRMIIRKQRLINEEFNDHTPNIKSTKYLDEDAEDFPKSNNGSMLDDADLPVGSFSMPGPLTKQ